MTSRNRSSTEGPTIVYDTEIPPHPFACNREARRMFFKSGQKHTAVPMEQLKNAGKGKDGKTIYFMGEERFIPPYLWRRVKQKPKAKRA